MMYGLDVPQLLFNTFFPFLGIFSFFGIMVLLFSPLQGNLPPGNHYQPPAWMNASSESTVYTKTFPLFQSELQRIRQDVT